MKPAFSLGIPAAFSLLFLATASTALAKPATVFMLQFGSFESTDEANQRVSSLKSKHGGLIGNMQSRVLEVKLPDNLTVYRTQAGPVPSRAEAKSICAQLASNGDECYVVETAMTNETGTTQMAQASAPQSVSFAKPLAPAPALETADAPAPSASVNLPPLPKVEAPATTELSPREQARQTIATEMSAVKSLESAPAITKSTTMAAAPSTPAPATKNAEMERPGFWSRMNPFSDDAAPKPVERAQPAPVETAVTPVESAPVEQRFAEAAPRPVLPQSTTPAPMMGAPEQPRAVLPVVPAAPVEQPRASLPLPPPPPMNDSAKKIFERNQQEAPMLQASAPAPAPAAQAPLGAMTAPAAAPVTSSAAAPFSKASTETLARLGKPVSPASFNAPTAGDGSVKVGEAQRVPLSSATQAPVGAPMYVPSGSSVAPADASIPIRTTPRMITPPVGVLAAPEVVLPASQNTRKTLWAELGPYKDAPSALAFWDTYRSKNPDFPVVRVRVIQSYGQKLRGDANVSLRVGPFAKQESITYLCGQFKEVQSLKCAPVTDMGITSSQTDGRTRQMQGEANLATQAMIAQNTPAMQGTYWLQLGSYPSLAQAQNSWGELKSRHGLTLSGLNPNISVPQLSSGARPTYRLRGGPFSTEVEATRACLALKSSGGSCIVSGNTQ